MGESSVVHLWGTDPENEAYQKTFGRVFESSDTPLVVRSSPSTGELYMPNDGGLVMALGAGPVQTLKDSGAIPKNRTVESLRGSLYPVGTANYMVSYSPNIIAVDASKPSVLAWDAQLALRYLHTGKLEPELGSYEWVTSFKYTRAYIEQKYEETGKPVDVSLDLETMGLWPWYPDKKIVTVQISPEVGCTDMTYMMDPIWKNKAELNRLIQEITWILTSPKVSLKGANLKFDLVWLLHKWGIKCTNFKMDTLLVGSLLNENRSNSLNMHTKEYTSIGGYDDHFNKKYDKGHMEEVPKHELTAYAGGDTDACLRVSIAMRKELQHERGLQRFYVKLLHPAARAFESIEERGVYVDQDKYAVLRKDLEARTKEVERECFQMMPRRLRIKYADNLSLSRPVVLKDYLFSPMGLNLKPKMVSEKTGQPSTSKDHLTLFEDDPEAKAFMELYFEWTGIQKTLGTYVDGFLSHLRPDGRFHPTYMLFNGSMFGGVGDSSGTVTGRTAAKNPAMQTLPKHTKWAKRLRECFPAPPGKLFWQADYSQGELKITACVANEPTMLQAYLASRDLHCVTGAGFVDMEYDEFVARYKSGDPEMAAYRSQAKPANFGLLYGMSATGYKEFARTAYGVILTQAEAEEQWESFFSTYYRLQPWHGEYKSMARQYGYVVSPLGRIRHLPLITASDGAVRSHAERQAVNSPIQSCLSDMCLWSIAELEERYGQGGELEIIGMTHDSIYGYAPEDTAVEWTQTVMDVMGNLDLELFDWKPQLQFNADGEVGTCMATLQELAA